MSEGALGGKSRRESLLASAVLLLVLAVFCAGTRWGRTYPTFVKRTSILLRSAPSLAPESRRVQLYDSTYPVILYLRDNTPEDAVILLPPGTFVDERTPGDIPLLASDTSVYSFIYPRIPVHWGEPSPSKDRIDHILVWEHWGLELASPGEPRSAENRVQLYPWPAGEKLRW